VVVFDGAYGGQTMDAWDPTDAGYYINHSCPFDDFPDAYNPECNYYRVADDLRRNGLSEAQVQAVFFKSATGFPECDLQHLFCSAEVLPDAYVIEQHLGNILRYLKCCTLDSHHQSTGNKRYPHLQQVFLTTRIYGGYANLAAQQQQNPRVCLNPEPFSYEAAFAVQRAIVAQINQDAGMQFTDPYSGTVAYKSDGTGNAPWVDWGPYLWADGTNKSPSSQLAWCDSTTTQNPNCFGNPGDVRYGDLDDATFWGDHTHPTYKGVEKVANQLVKFIQGTLPAPQTYISDWVVPWLGK
jgi:hypothetical protein